MWSCVYREAGNVYVYNCIVFVCLCCCLSVCVCVQYSLHCFSLWYCSQCLHASNLFELCSFLCLPFDLQSSSSSSMLLSLPIISKPIVTS